MGTRPIKTTPSKKHQIKKLEKKNKKLEKKNKKLEAQLKDLKDRYSKTKNDLYQIIDSPNSDETKPLIEVIKRRREFKRNTYQVLMFGNAGSACNTV